MGAHLVVGVSDHALVSKTCFLKKVCWAFFGVPWEREHSGNLAILVGRPSKAKVLEVMLIQEEYERVLESMSSSWKVSLLSCGSCAAWSSNRI